MSNKILNAPIKCLTGTGIAAGILSSSTAQAQLVVANPDQSLTVSQSNLYFNVSTPNAAFTTTNSGAMGAAEFEAPDVEPSYIYYEFGKGNPYVDKGSAVNSDANDGSALVLFSDADLSGQTADATTVDDSANNTSFDLTTGTHTYGLALQEDDGEHYGYITVTQTGSYDGLTGADNNLTDTVNTLAFDETAGEGVAVPDNADAVPEPSTLGLLGAAGAGLAGLALYRRMRKA